MPVLPSYRNQSIDLLTGFYMKVTLALNELSIVSVYYQEAITTEFVQCLIHFGRPKDVLIASYGDAWIVTSLKRPHDVNF